MATQPSSAQKKQFLSAALKAADWFVNSQVKGLWKGDANLGRFLYYYFRPEGKIVPGINWSHGRALFVLTDAYKITGDKKYLASMELGARYMQALQPLDPHYRVTYGAFHEMYPSDNWGGMLDGAQAASGLLMLYRVTGNADYLRHGQAFCDFIVRNWRKDLGMPRLVTFQPETVQYPGDPIDCIHHATAIPLWHCYNITGEGRYAEVIVDAADRVLACQRNDGGINAIPDIRALPTLPFNHHWGLGEGDDKYLLRNDDGVAVVVLAAYFLTGKQAYLDAMVRYGEWTMANEPHERPFNAFGIQAANVLDIAKVAGLDWTPWVLKHVKQHCLRLQVHGSKDERAEGGFRGEDEEGNAGIFGGKSLDYVVTRVTCYMAGVLFRLSGQGTGTGFSVFGTGELQERYKRGIEDNVAPSREKKARKK